MRRPGIWWIGLASAAALWLAAIQFETPRLERDLTERADAVLRIQLGETSKAFAKGRDLWITGSAFDESARKAAVAAVSALPGVRRVDVSLAPPPPSPHDGRAERNGDAAILSAATPSAAPRVAGPGDETKGGPADNPAAATRDVELPSAPPSVSTPSPSPSPSSPELSALTPPEAAARRGDEVAAPSGNGVREKRQAAEPRPAEAPPSSTEAAAEPRPPVQAPAKARDEACRDDVAEAARATEIGFAPGGAGLSSESIRALKTLAAAARRCPEASLRISGFARGVGRRPGAADRDAIDLSWRRAEAAAAFLLAEGVPGQSLEIVGLAEDAPASSADRRVDIRVK